MSELRLWLLAWILLKQDWVMSCHCDSLSGYAAFVVVLIRWWNVPDTHSPSGKQTGGFNWL
ncbi:hypothetical protein H4F47_14590 [Pectobacterium brasiliense]|uniref:hypothetical protein n=1 Tax=Pectobacterium TaxID=122277 RepID=UPI00103E5E5A|nr:hypothetical protein [Pectobacterium brasiliense]MBN3044141.1 hypothetical protein [Pectobacterium brasiliense]